MFCHSVTLILLNDIQYWLLNKLKLGILKLMTIIIIISSTLDHKTACNIATYLIHSKLDYCNSLYLNIINSQQLKGFNSFLTLLLVLSQKLKNSITLLLIWNPFTGSKLNNAYNTKFSHLLRSHFSTTNIPPFVIFSPYNQLVLPAPSAVVTLQCPSTL